MVDRTVTQEEIYGILSHVTLTIEAGVTGKVNCGLVIQEVNDL